MVGGGALARRGSRRRHRAAWRDGRWPLTRAYVGGAACGPSSPKSIVRSETLQRDHAMLAPERPHRGWTRRRLARRVSRRCSTAAKAWPLPSRHEAAAERAPEDTNPEFMEHLAAGDLAKFALIDTADLDAPVLAVGLPIAHPPRRATRWVRNVVGEQPDGSRTGPLPQPRPPPARRTRTAPASRSRAVAVAAHAARADPEPHDRDQQPE